jgi:hypothetical protein
MRIHDQNLTGPSVNDAGKTQETQRTTGTSPASSRAAGGHGDRVEFSNALGTLSRAIASDDSSRADRVQQLAAGYASGNYRPDLAATSHGIIADAFAAGGR